SNPRLMTGLPLLVIMVLLTVAQDTQYNQIRTKVCKRWSAEKLEEREEQMDPERLLLISRAACFINMTANRQKAEDGIYQGKQTSDDDLISKSSSEKEFFKLMVNSGFGKMLQQDNNRLEIMRHADKQHKGLIE
ncbi:hypothetical protein PROFUN_17154, partial [Planoprotostelium fungivorum]